MCRRATPGRTQDGVDITGVTVVEHCGAGFPGRDRFPARAVVGHQSGW